MKHVIIALAALGLPLYATEWHVATSGNDQNEGRGPAPFRTIQRAAEAAQPGDVITIHAGVYRERVNPPRGGESDAKRITYQAAPGEQVEIKGSEVVKDWTKVEGDVWKVTLPNSFFGNFNPFKDLIRGDWFNPKGREHHTGAVYLNGDWLVEAATLDAVLGKSAAKPPAKSARKNYIINLTWLRPGAGAEKILFTSMTGNHELKKAPCSEGGECVGWLEPGDWLLCERVEFKQPTEQIELRVSCAAAGATIEVRRDSAEGELLSSQAVANTGGWQSWVTCKLRTKPLTGVQKLCFVFQRGGPAAPVAPLWFAQVTNGTTTIWAQFKGVNPNEQLVEVNARQTVFYPDQPGRNFITVRGFVMRHAATPWAPPTAEQPGLIGTHWSKGWIIENNTISHSTCSGIALGKHGDQFDNTSANSAEGYVKTIERAHAHPIAWTKENIGHHIVRNNHISHCEQTGIVGSLGCAFSTVTGNVIHDIHIRRLFSGAEMAGIKFHASIDVVISGNHIYRSGTFAIWLDWMAQGTQVTGNLLHDNEGPDLFMEVDHGPYVIANNIMLSQSAHLANSRGGAYVHNLVAGTQRIMHDNRQTPYHKAHSTDVVALHNCPIGDVRWYNNVLFSRCNLNAYDKAPLPVAMAGNVFLKGATPGQYETAPLLKADFDPGAAVVEKDDGWYLDVALDKSWRAEQTRKLVTGELLGTAQIPNLPFENRDGSPLRIDTDYFGKKRDASNPFPGPFENPGSGELKLKVW
jgi:hypothetical protein